MYYLQWWDNLSGRNLIPTEDTFALDQGQFRPVLKSSEEHRNYLSFYPSTHVKGATNLPQSDLLKLKSVGSNIE